MEAIAIKDFALNINDKLIDLESFIETDTYVSEESECFMELDEMAYHIYRAKELLDSFIEKHYPEVITGATPK